MIRTKRVYEKPDPEDGYRVLVDRLWPRGLVKEDARIDLWAEELAPSTVLRQWFSHDDEKWPEFERRYVAELRRAGENPQIDAIRDRAREGTVTLLYAAKNERHNNAVVLMEYLEAEPRQREENDGDSSQDFRESCMDCQD
ncbi:MAG: DUF488 domain-containing protein [Methanobacteriota archaeon]|nr:MAG: DUF488 domain-containing protein [Euryarchaeota archaeon]